MGQRRSLRFNWDQKAPLGPIVAQYAPASVLLTGVSLSEASRQWQMGDGTPRSFSVSSSSLGSTVVDVEVGAFC